MLLNSQAQHFKNGPRNKRLTPAVKKLYIIIYLHYLDQTYCFALFYNNIFLTTRLYSYKTLDITNVRDNISLLKWFVKNIIVWLDQY